jgi:hypothetical protein
MTNHMQRIKSIRTRLMSPENQKWVRENPLSAAELDLERKVLANEYRRETGQPRAYVPLYY